MRQDKGGVKVTNLFELFATITLDTSGYDKGLQNVKKSSAEYRSDVMKLAQTYKKQGMDMSEAMKRAYAEIDKSQYETAESSKSDAKKFAQSWENAGKNISDVADKIKNGLATAAKVGTATITAAATGIAALTKASVDNYAEYEQLVGGAELMFGGAYDFIADKAKNAYSTVQMSQNEYLQQVNGFATGLKTALGGNEQAAAELADRIINAEADIVAATGNAAENVQNAFNGIMKSNYTMLDNLQLGITPTKEGFQEVIDKVNEWNAANGNATNYMIDNLADAQNALVDYIEMQGLAGYAANEASQTISGSFASAKAAWSNLVTGVADDNADFNKLINNFVNSVSTAAKNLVPRVKTAIVGIGQLISQTLPIIVNEIPAIIKDVVPDLLNAAMDLVSAIGQGLLDNAGSLLSSALDLVTKLVDFIIQGLPSVLTATLQIIQTIGNGLVEYAPKLITSVTDVVLKLVDMLTDPEQLNKLLDVGITFVSTVGQALIDNVGKITEKIPEIVQNLVDFFLNPEQLGKVIDMGVSFLTSLISNTAEIISVIVSQIPVIIDGIVNAFTSGDNLEKIIAAGVDLFVSIISNTGEIIRLIAEKIPEITGSIVTAFAEVDWLSVGKDIMNGIIDGMMEVMTLVGDLPTMISNWAKGAEYGDINYKMTTKDFENQMEWGNASWQERYEAQQKATGNTVINQNNYFTGDSTIMGQKKALDEMMAAIQAQQ